MRYQRICGAVGAALGLGLIATAAAAQTPGYAVFGEPKYEPGFDHFDYVNPEAPQGGELRLGTMAAFDNFNPFIQRGTAPSDLRGLIYQSLVVRSADEPMSYYGSLASDIAIGDDFTTATFTLRDEARFHDGEPITAQDVVWSYETLMAKGVGGFRNIYGDIEKAEALDERTVRFTLARPDRELAISVGTLPVLPKHWWTAEGRDLGKPLNEPPLGSGAYRVGSYEEGRTISYERVSDWWAEDLAVNVGRWNFETIRYDVYRDRSVMFEAFRGGEFDLFQENEARRWANSYDFEAVETGRVQKELIEHDETIGFQGFAFNTRREPFRNRAVRQALTYMLDFESLNETLFYGQYDRTTSYFENSDKAARGLPDGQELALLEEHRDALPPAVFNEPFSLPSAEELGGRRALIREALTLFDEAGWELAEGKLIHSETGEQLSFEIMVAQQAMADVALNYADDLERIGVDVQVRNVDTTSYINRLHEFDFDMTPMSYPASEAPGNELANFFTSEAAETPASFNLAGIKNSAIDALVDEAINAQSWEELVAATRALDRALLWGFYAVPHWHLAAYRVAYWNVFGQPETRPTYGLGIEDTWWRARDEARAAD